MTLTATTDAAALRTAIEAVRAEVLLRADELAAAAELALKARRSAAKARQGTSIGAMSRASQAQRQVQAADADQVGALVSRYATLHQVLQEVTA